MELKPNYAITYRGGKKFLVYDEKGRVKTGKELGVEQLKLIEGSNNLRISAEFSGGDDIKLEGYVRLKDKVESIVAK